jgi:vacuolar-type H+-ATPase subunit F/Vma7
MRLSVIGTAEDVIGFALAGSPGLVCATGVEVAAALDRECRDPEVALVLVSSDSAGLAPDAVQRWRAAGAPLVIVLPATERADEGAGRSTEAV